MTPPQHIKDACVAALQAGKTKYVATAGIDDLRKAIAESYASSYGLKVAPGQVVVSPGGKFSCFLTIMATCSPGDEVIIPAPYWVSYPEMAKLAGAVPKAVLATDKTDFKLTPAQLEAAVTPRSRLLILNSPCNPTGVVYSRQELAALMDVAVRHNLYVLSDEMYEKLVYDGAAPTCLATLGPEAEARTIVVSGFSKTFSMTGWRLGTLVAPPPIAKAAAEIQGQTASNATAFAQYGAIAALRETEKTKASLERMLVAFDRRRKLLPRGPDGRSRGSHACGAGRLLPLPQRVVLRPGLRGVLREAPRGREGRGRPRLGLRRRGLRSDKLRHKR